VSPQSFAKGFGLQSRWISKPSSPWDSCDALTNHPHPGQKNHNLMNQMEEKKNWPWIQGLVSSMVPLGFGSQSGFPNHHHRTFLMLWQFTLIPRRRITTHGELNEREKNCPWIQSSFDSTFGDKKVNKCPHPNGCRGESQCWQLLSFAFF
jgi:hypothetical protein